MAGQDGIAVYSTVKAVAGLNTDNMTRAIIRLAGDGVLKEVQTVIGVGVGSSGKRSARGLMRCKSGGQEGE